MTLCKSANPSSRATTCWTSGKFGKCLGLRNRRILLFFLMMICSLHSEATEVMLVKVSVTGASNTKCDAIPNVVCYWEQAVPHLSMKTKVVGSAVNGSTAAEFNQQFAERILPNYDSLFKYNILALQTGGNDILANASAEITFGNLKDIVKKWKELAPGNFAVVATVPRFGYTASQLFNADELNQMIRSEPTFDATFDLGAIPDLNYGVGCPPAELVPDCSHLTTAGNTLVSKLFVAAINSILIRFYR